MLYKYIIASRATRPMSRSRGRFLMPLGNFWRFSVEKEAKPGAQGARLVFMDPCIAAGNFRPELADLVGGSTGPVIGSLPARLGGEASAPDRVASRKREREFLRLGEAEGAHTLCRAERPRINGASMKLTPAIEIARATQQHASEAVALPLRHRSKSIPVAWDAVRKESRP
jgi:hypothetical protein